LEPAIQKWLAQKPKDVIFQRIPVGSKGSWLAYAKAYYALQQLNRKRAEKLTPLIFQAVHKHNQRLYDTDTFLAWASKHGVNQDRLAKALNSQAVINKLEDGKNLDAQYGVTGVPTIFVDGRYEVIYGRNTPINDIPEKINQLIDKAKLERTSKRKYKR
jgi:protein dithiol oxidoreductase (disulfide-forming)